MAAAVRRLFRASIAQHVSAIPWGISATAVLRPDASGRMSLTNILCSGSHQAKFFSTSSSYHTLAVTQHTSYFKGTAVVNREFKDLKIVAFSDEAKEFHKVVAVSVDSHFSHLAWINTPRKNGGLDYGVLLEGPGLTLRGLFLIDPSGVIKHLSVNNLPVGRSMKETLCLMKALQYIETYGEVCPANGTLDSPAIKPNPAASREPMIQVNQERFQNLVDNASQTLIFINYLETLVKFEF
uniref:thioredoxin-dependent peroxiredoxin n=1 Tax=Aotus nancymaae TaxID=37293 RepID=A0A2K5ER44_AOTNA